MSELKDRITVRKNSGADVGTRPRINFIDGVGVTSTITEDAVDNEIDVQLDVTGAGSGGMTIADYIIYKSGVNYYGISGDDGSNVSTSISFYTVLTTVIAAATAGDTIYIKPAIYSLNAEVSISKQLHIHGGGWGTTIAVSAPIAGAALKFTASYSTLTNIYIDGNAQSSYGVHIDNCTRIECYRVRITDTTINGFHIDNAAHTATTSHKLVQCISGSNTRHGVYIGSEQTDIWISRCTIYSNGKAGIAIDGSGNQFSSNHIWGNDVGYLLSPGYTAVRCIMTNDYIEDNATAEIFHGTYGGVACKSFYDLSLVNCMFWCASHDLRGGTAASLVYFNPPAGIYTSRVTITGCLFNCEYGATDYADYGLYIGSRNINSTYTSNIFYSAAIAQINIVQTSNIIRSNEGFKTEAHGTDAIASGTTTKTVTHGLSYTPALADINIVLLEEATNDHGPVHLTNATSTTFDVTCRSDPGASNLGFGWNIMRTNL